MTSRCLYEMYRQYGYVRLRLHVSPLPRHWNERDTGPSNIWVHWAKRKSLDITSRSASELLLPNDRWHSGRLLHAPHIIPVYWVPCQYPIFSWKKIQGDIDVYENGWLVAIYFYRRPSTCNGMSATDSANYLTDLAARAIAATLVFVGVRRAQNHQPSTSWKVLDCASCVSPDPMIAIVPDHWRYLPMRFLRPQGKLSEDHPSTPANDARTTWYRTHTTKSYSTNTTRTNTRIQ